MLDQNEEVNFRLLALGFGRSIPTAPRRLRAPSIRPEDVFCVVDLYRRSHVANGKKRRVIEASWICSIEYPGLGNTNIRMPAGAKALAIHGANPYSSQHQNSEHVREWKASPPRHSHKTPLHYAAYDVVGLDVMGEHVPSRSLRAKVTLFRKDNMKSVCVMDEDIVDCATGGDQDPAEEVIRFYYHNKDTLRFDNGEAGQNARALAKRRVFSRLSLDGEFYLKATLPGPGSSEEDMWLAKSRHIVRTMDENHVYIPDAKDQAALSTIPSFGFEVKRFSFVFRVSTDTPYDFWDEFDCQDDMMIAIEGLCWQ
jgi:hypothetical protein